MSYCIYLNVTEERPLSGNYDWFTRDGKGLINLTGDGGVKEEGGQGDSGLDL